MFVFTCRSNGGVIVEHLTISSSSLLHGWRALGKYFSVVGLG